MKRIAPLVMILTAALPLFFIGPAVRAKECERPADRPFKIFNGLFYKDQPDLSQYGLIPIHIIDRKIWAPGVSRSGPPDPEMVKHYVDGLPKDKGPIVLDFEDYDLTKDEAQAREGSQS